MKYSNRDPIVITPGIGGELVKLTAEDGSEDRHFIVDSDLSSGTLNLIPDPMEGSPSPCDGRDRER